MRGLVDARKVDDALGCDGYATAFGIHSHAPDCDARCTGYEPIHLFVGERILPHFRVVASREPGVVLRVEYQLGYLKSSVIVTLVGPHDL